MLNNVSIEVIGTVWIVITVVWLCWWAVYLLTHRQPTVKQIESKIVDNRSKNMEDNNVTYVRIENPVGLGIGIFFGFFIANVILLTIAGLLWALFAVGSLTALIN